MPRWGSLRQSVIPRGMPVRQSSRKTRPVTQTYRNGQVRNDDTPRTSRRGLRGVGGWYLRSERRLSPPITAHIIRRQGEAKGSPPPIVGFFEVCITVQSLSSGWCDESCVLTISTPAVRHRYLMMVLTVVCVFPPSFTFQHSRPGFADLCLQIFKALINGPMGVARAMNRTDHCLYFITSGLILFPAHSVLYFPPVPLRGLRSRAVVRCRILPLLFST